MNDALRQELFALEERYWRALKEKDVETALSLTSDPCIVAGAQGAARIDKAVFASMMRSSDWAIEKFELRDAVIEQPADGVAIVGYNVREELTVAGKPVVLEAADTSTWVRKNGGWVCALHTESLLGDPYGRDRTRQG